MGFTVGPLSITASIIAVVQITSKVISIYYDYRCGLKNVPKGLQQLTDEIVSLRDVLKRLMKVVGEAPPGKSTFLATEQLTKNYGPLAQRRMEMEELEKKLKPAKGFMALDQMLKWPLRESDVTKRLAKLNRFKSTLIVSLTANVGGTYHRTWAN